MPMLVSASLAMRRSEAASTPSLTKRTLAACRMRGLMSERGRGMSGEFLAEAQGRRKHEHAEDAAEPDELAADVGEMGALQRDAANDAQKVRERQSLRYELSGGRHRLEREHEAGE